MVLKSVPNSSSGIGLVTSRSSSLVMGGGTTIAVNGDTRSIDLFSISIMTVVYWNDSTKCSPSPISASLRRDSFRSLHARERYTWSPVRIFFNCHLLHLRSFCTAVGQPPVAYQFLVSFSPIRISKVLRISGFLWPDLFGFSGRGLGNFEGTTVKSAIEVDICSWKLYTYVSALLHASQSRGVPQRTCPAERGLYGCIVRFHHMFVDGML